MNQKSTTIGFIGQGWIGRHYADDFENRGYVTVRYALEEPYKQNQARIATCRITLIAVPTPTTPHGFDDSILKDALLNIGAGNIAVIKSTTTPGLVAQLQNEFPNIFILHSPEFLVERTAAYDAAYPNRNIIGVPVDTEEYRALAKEILAVLPKAPYEAIMTTHESELVKYAGNCFLYTKVLFMNILYDVVTKGGGNFESVRDALAHDPRIGESHTKPIHYSGHQENIGEIKRGAGGHCFIKDFEAFRHHYQGVIGSDTGYELLSKMVEFNNELLRTSGKDLDLLEGVYGSGVLKSDHCL